MGFTGAWRTGGSDRNGQAEVPGTFLCRLWAPGVQGQPLSCVPPVPGLGLPGTEQVSICVC